MLPKITHLVLVICLLCAPALASAQSESGSGCTIGGPSNAALTIEEFSDFQCPYCARGASALKQAAADFPAKVRIVFRNMPLEFHPYAATAAKAFSAICLQNPVLAGAFQNELFASQDELGAKGESHIFAVAEKVGANIERLKMDINGSEVAKALAADKAAFAARGFEGTPSFVIGRDSLSGAYPYAEIKKRIEAQLKK